MWEKQEEDFRMMADGIDPKQKEEEEKKAAAKEAALKAAADAQAAQSAAAAAQSAAVVDIATAAAVDGSFYKATAALRARLGPDGEADPVDDVTAGSIVKGEQGYIVCVIILFNLHEFK